MKSCIYNRMDIFLHCNKNNTIKGTSRPENNSEQKFELA